MEKISLSRRNNTRLRINIVKLSCSKRKMLGFVLTGILTNATKAQFLALSVLLFLPSLPRYSIWFSVTTVATAVDLSRVHDPCVARRCSWPIHKAFRWGSRTLVKLNSWWVGARTRFHVLARSSLSLSNGIWYKWKFLFEPTFVPEFRIHLVCLAPPERGEERITLSSVVGEKISR